MNGMNVLLIYPKYPDTFFSFTHALHFISKKAAIPPLGLITVSALLPENWQKKLLDMNVTDLLPEDLEWADYVFISAMYIQKESVNNVIEECRKHEVKIVAGGPLFNQEHKNYPQIDHFILNEAEITLAPFLNNLAKGIPPQKLYETAAYADIISSPTPEFHLLDRKAYASMNIQISRGCPFACDFCEISSLLGHKVRMKQTDQVIRELDALFHLKWRGNVSITDDNFIGNKRQIKNELLPAIIEWMRRHKYPFIFNIQTSIDLADDKELISLMIQAGINSTFIGIETPSEQSLYESNKLQNQNRDMLLSVKEIQASGMQVSGGFIVGFDSDSVKVFQEQIDFIQQSGIVWAMVGLLNAPKNTKLYERLKAENRLTTEATGSNTDYSMNFIPKMDAEELQKGYKSIIENIYSVKPYYTRMRQFLVNYKQAHRRPIKIERHYFKAFIKSLLIIGIQSKGRGEFWKFIFWTVWNRPRLFLDAIMFTISGYHFRKVYRLTK